MKLNSSKYTQQTTLSRGHNLFESVLTIHDLNENDLNNKYECEAMNQLGVNRLAIELVERSRPDRPTDVRVMHVDFMSVSLTWSPGFDGGLTQTFFLDLNGSSQPIEIGGQPQQESKFRAVSTGASSLNLTHLNYDTTYSLRLMARNSLGASEWSDRVRVHTHDITDASVRHLPQFEALFLNVPKNRLEFVFKGEKAVSSNQSAIVPICLRLTGVTLQGAARDAASKWYAVVKCLPLSETDYVNGRYALDSNTDLMMMLNDQDESEKSLLSKKNDATQIGFDSKTVKSLRVSVCFAAKPSICNPVPVSAIIGKK